MQTRTVIAALFACLLAFANVATVSAAVYNVNWITPRPVVKGKSTQALSICTGDSVKFAWNGGYHNIGRATRGFYRKCSGAGFKRISPDTTKYTRTIKFNKVGTRHYVCNYGSHCAIGQKLRVTVRKCAGK